MPSNNNKRKRPERQPSDTDGRRPSPYRPERARVTSQPPNAPTPPSRHERDQPAQSEAQPPSTDTVLNEVNGLMSEPQDPPQKSESRFAYSYGYLTDDVVSAWGQEEMQKLTAQAADIEDADFDGFLGELLRAGLDGRIPAQDAGTLIKAIRAAEFHSDVDSRLLNLASLLDDSDHNQTLRLLLASTGIPPQTMRQELDVALLMALGLVRTTFDKMRTRKTTNALYRQANFNLLREESEGYAKLMSDYFNTAQEASAPTDHDPVLAEDAFERVKALVGAFDLDVGRVLDITLDVSANLLVKAYSFFTDFYRASSWWPDNQVMDGLEWDSEGFEISHKSRDGGISGAQDMLGGVSLQRRERDARFWDRVREHGINAFFDMGARRITNFDAMSSTLSQEVPPELDARGKEANPDKRIRANEDRKYMLETRTLPPFGNSDAAQLLGFKLKFYASPNRDAADTLPQNIVHLVALLIKIGFISLRDLYPHLYPSDEAMAQERTRLEREKAERDAKDRPGGGMNALAAAGALVDDTLPAPRAVKTEKDRSGGATPSVDDKKTAEEVLPAPENQKIALLNALLLVGALPEALHILSRFPWIADVDERVPQSLQRTIRYMLSKMTESTRPAQERVDLDMPRERLADGAAKGDHVLGFERPVLRKPMRWLNNDAVDKTEGTSYRHYYNEWNDNLPICRTIDDVFLLCGSLVPFIGPKIGQDVTAYGTLLRLAKSSLSTDNTKENHDRWLDLLKQLLVPALSLSKQNPDLAQQLFDVLHFYPTSVRYNIYAEWFTGRTSRLLDVKGAFDRNKAEIRDVLRRVSRDTERRQGRALAKVAISSPGIVVTEMINQLESYSNMIPSLVECTKHFSSLAYDVLTWALINSLSGQGRDRIQPDGMLTSSWLQALSQFVASLFAKYAHLNPSPILQYLASELRAGNSTDLALFEQILVEMAGIRSDVELNDNQVLAMGGGEHLQTHILQQLSDTRHLKKHTTAKRLIKGLAGPHLIGQTLIAIAQERQLYSYHASSQYMPLKVLGNNLDKVQAVLAQYLDVLRTNLTPQQFEDAVPGTVSLIKEFGLEPGLALTICRVAIRYRMSEFDATKKLKLNGRNAKADGADGESGTNGDVQMLEALESKPDDAETASKGEPAVPDDADDELENGAFSAVPDARADVPWHPVLLAIIDELTLAAPEFAAKVSLPFFTTFWTLNLQDVIHPQDLYEAETARLKAQINDIAADRSDTVAVQAKEREKRKRALQANLEKLSSEPRERMQIHQAIKLRIAGSTRKSEKAHWFPRTTVRSEIDARHLGLLQECFIPRAIMSPVDSHYAFQMLHIMHSAATPGFSVMHLCHQLFKKQLLAGLIFQFTAIEASNFGRFLYDTLKLLQRWHEKKEVYEQEAIQEKKKTFLSFVKTFDENGEPKSTIDFEEFRRMLSNFHVALNSALQTCFESAEFMHIRNGIIVLKAIHRVFPALTFMGKNMVDHVTAVSQKDTRQDLKLAAMSLLGPLKNREKDWVIPQKFRNAAKDNTSNAAGGQGQTPATETGSARSGTPKLDATAAEFKPVVNNANEKTRKDNTSGGKEDGEIDDEKAAALRSGEAKSSNASNASASKQVNGNPPTPAADTPKPAEGEGDTEHKHQAVSGVQDKAAAQRTETKPSLPDKRTSTRKGQPRSELQSQASSYDHPARPNRYNGRDDGYGRLDRPNDIKPASRDQSPAPRSRGRSPASVTARDSGRDERAPVRPAGLSDQRRQSHMSNTGRESPSQTPSRTPLQTRDNINNAPRPAEVSSQVERPKQLSSVVATSTASDVSKLPARPPASEVLPLQTSGSREDVQHNVNPARLAMINADVQSGDPSARRPPPAQATERDQRRDRDFRPNDRVSNFPPRPDSRTNGRGQPESPRPPPSADSGPVRSRPPRYGGHDPMPPSSESSYGRLNDSTHSPASNARPNNASNAPARRNITAPGSMNDFRMNDTASAAPLGSRPVVSSAVADNGPSRTPGNSRPDRSQLNDIAQSSDDGPSVHPSRAARLEQTPTIQTNFAAPNGPRPGGSPTVGPPSGPRNQRSVVSTPTAPSPANNMPPTGPASGPDRQRKGDRQRASINATLQSSTPPASIGSQGVSFRGASNRPPTSSASGTPALRSAVTPTVASAIDFGPSASSSATDAASSRPDHHHLPRNPNAPDRRDHAGKNDYRHDNHDSPSFRGGPDMDNRDRRGPVGPPPPPAYSRGPSGRDDRPPPFNPRSGPDRRGPHPPSSASDPSRRDGPNSGFGHPHPDWNDRRDGGGRGGSGGGAGGDDHRGRRDDDRRGGGGGAMMQGPPSTGPPGRDGRDDGPDRRNKRPHPQSDEGFDPTKRRRSAR